jgi:polyferredoxin
VLALLNKRWLEGSIRSILSAARWRCRSGQQSPPWTASKLILRYLILAFCFGIAVWTGLFHPLGMAIGFASFVGGVMIEAGIPDLSGPQIK